MAPRCLGSWTGPTCPLCGLRLPQRLVARDSPLDLLHRTVAGAKDVPDAGARTEGGNVSLAVAIEVAGDGHVARRSPRHLLEPAVAGAKDVPDAGARAEGGDVGLAVAIEVAGDGHVAGRSPRDQLRRAVAGAKDVPDAGARAVDSDIGLGVTVEIRVGRGRWIGELEPRDVGSPRRR